MELYGPESGGKSYCTLKAIGSFQKAGLRAGLIDVERSFTKEWGEFQGVDTNNLLYGNDFSAEEALGYARSICQRDW